jgi:flagellar motility protein MotE (MotC chaperone)
LQEKRRLAQQRVEVQKDQKKAKTMDTVIQFGTTVLGAIFGRKKMSAANMGKVGTSARSAGKILSQQSKVDDAEENVAAIDERIAALEADFKTDNDKLNEMSLPDKLNVSEFNVQPKKTDIDIDSVVLAWNPTIVSKDSK